MMDQIEIRLMPDAGRRICGGRPKLWIFFAMWAKAETSVLGERFLRSAPLVLSRRCICKVRQLSQP